LGTMSIEVSTVETAQPHPMRPAPEPAPPVCPDVGLRSCNAYVQAGSNCARRLTPSRRATLVAAVQERCAQWRETRMLGGTAASREVNLACRSVLFDLFEDPACRMDAAAELSAQFPPSTLRELTCKPAAGPPLEHDKHGPVEVVLGSAGGATGVRAAAVFIDGVPALAWSGGADPASAALAAGNVASARVRLSHGMHAVNAVVWVHARPPSTVPIITQTVKCLEIKDDEPSTLGLTVNMKGPGGMPWPRIESPLLVDDGM